MRINNRGHFVVVAMIVLLFASMSACAKKPVASVEQADVVKVEEAADGNGGASQEPGVAMGSAESLDTQILADAESLQGRTSVGLFPLYFDFDNGDIVYATTNLNRDKLVIAKYDMANAKELDIIYQHPEVDVSSLLVSKKRKVITGVAFYTDKRHYHFFDDTRKDLQKNLQQKLLGYEVKISSMSKEEDKVLVRTFSDRSLGSSAAPGGSSRTDLVPVYPR